MKKLLLLAMLSSMIGTAHATRSRMNSLGQDPNQGSFYFGDNRNFFRNPANTAKMRNYMVAELSTDYTGAANNSDNNVEGGYFGEFNTDLAYGVYLGKKTSNLTPGMAAMLALDPDDLAIYMAFPNSTNANPLNLFLGGGADMKWGLNINYADSEFKESNGTNSFSSIGVGLGIETSKGLQAYINYPIQIKAELGEASLASSPTEGGGFTEIKSTGFQVGLIYPVGNDYTVWGQFSAAGSKWDGPNKPEYEQETNSYIIGVGKVYELSPTSRFNFDLSFNMSGTENKETTKAEITKTTLPLVIGLEADATEWLILRGSVRQNFILGNYKIVNGGTTTENSTDSDTAGIGGTEVAIGGTLHFGKLKIDGNLGGFGAGADSNGNEDASLFNTTNFFVNAAVTYMF